MPHQDAVEPYTLKAGETILHLGIREGEFIVVQPGTDQPVLAVRPLAPNYGAILGALTTGQLTPVTHPLDAVMAALARLTRLSPSQPRPRPALRARSRRSGTDGD